MAEIKQSVGAYTAMTVTNLHSTATDATAPFTGQWQSERVSNVSTLALDYTISVKIAAVNTTPANDQCLYVYVAPCMTTDGGTTWTYVDDGSTTDLLDGAEGKADIGTTHNMKLLGVLAYGAQNTILSGQWNLSTAIGQSMPDGFQIVIHNCSGMTLAASGNVVAYRAITNTVV